MDILLRVEGDGALEARVGGIWRILAGGGGNGGDDSGRRTEAPLKQMRSLARAGREGGGRVLIHPLEASDMNLSAEADMG